jgi:hypothetical protein
MIRLPKLKPVTLPKPRLLAIKPPTIPPTIPKMLVMIKPPGSFPGVISFAIAPTIRPKIIQDIIPIPASSSFFPKKRNKV